MIDLQSLATFVLQLPTRLRPQTQPIEYAAKNGWSGATFHRWKSAQGPLVLKIWPGDGPAPHEHLARHRYLTGLSAFQPTLALPLPNLAGATLMSWPDGRSAELFPWLDGRPAASVPPNSQQLSQAMTTLARLHKHWAKAQPTLIQPSPAVIHRLTHLRKIQQSSALETTIPALSNNAPEEFRHKFQTICDLSRWLIGHAADWLAKWQHQPLRTQVVLRDARPEHFLFIDDKLSGIIDFGAIGMDSVAVDLTRLLNDWFPDDKLLYNQAIRCYQSESALQDQEIFLAEKLSQSGAILGGLAWVDLYFHKGRAKGRESEFLNALDLAIKRLRKHVLR